MIGLVAASVNTSSARYISLIAMGLSAVLSALLSPSALANPNLLDDYQRYADSGEVRILGIEDTPFLSVWHSEQTPFKHGTAWLYPDWGEGPSSSQVIKQLRERLPALGWESVAMQLPSLPGPAFTIDEEEPLTALFDQLTQRSEQAFESREQAFGFELVIAQGMTASWLVDYYSQHSQALPDGLVLLDAYAEGREQAQQLAEKSSLLTIPVLDIVTSGYHPWSEQSAELRRIANYKRQKINYRQTRLIAPLHGVEQYETSQLIYGWLSHLGWQ
ncbi:DUF3530 family protein [Aliagarivorans taiwanensis]|uniref:DUF3530 family protein n=1 Tax=Aliagarivorans taiwanensis TaxID=561966 RepID=UPI000409A0C7|nr:DUF3530 family protein [Aliagarivorans taiwanensis]